MFGDDSFMGIEDLFNQLSEGRRGYSQDVKTQSQNILNTVELEKETILIFDIPEKKVVLVKIKDDLKTNEYGEMAHIGQKILAIEFENNEVLKYNIPKHLSIKKISHTFVHGILEVTFKK